MNTNNLLDYPPIILASQSPRRKSLLSLLGVPFTSVSLSFDESFDLNVTDAEDVPELLACRKADFASHLLTKSNLIITSDTLVLLDGQIMGKPSNREHAYEMISQLSGRSSKVISGVCLQSKKKKVSFSSCTNIEFATMTNKEIQYYIEHYKPLDKAGAYGIQEWIGMAFIERIDGCYNNVVGLPTSQLYKELKSFIDKDKSL